MQLFSVLIEFLDIFTFSYLYLKSFLTGYIVHLTTGLVHNLNHRQLHLINPHQDTTCFNISLGIQRQTRSSFGWQIITPIFAAWHLTADCQK